MLRGEKILVPLQVKYGQKLSTDFLLSAQQSQLVSNTLGI